MRADELLMIVPTRGRPASIEPLVQAWRETGSQAALLLALDDDDPELGHYWDAIARLDSLSRVYAQTGPRHSSRLAGILNTHAVARALQYAGIGFMGDDHRPRTPGWDTRFAECLSGGGPGLVYGNDLLVGQLFPTAVMMTANIVSTLGYMCPPGFTHLCLDLVWRDWGERLGRLTYLDDVVIEHLHPHAGKAAPDARYEEVNSSAMVAADGAAYYDYRDNGGLAADVEKLRTLL